MFYIDDSLLRLSLEEQLEQLRQTEGKNPQQNPIDKYLGLAKHYYLSNNNSIANINEIQPWQAVLQAGCKFNPQSIQPTVYQFQLISQVLYLSWFSNNKDQQIFSNFANYLFHLVPIKGNNDELLVNPNYNAIHGFILLNNWELTKSLDKFQLALYHSPTHYAALMGRAMVKMQLREYNTALTLFQDCYKLIVSLPGRQHLRVGDPRPFIAICLVLLDQQAKAKNLFQTLSDESPQNPEYKLYLALMEWNQIKISLRHIRSKTSVSVITNEDELKFLENLENNIQNITTQPPDLSPPDLHNFIKVTHETLHQNPQHPLSNFMVAEYLYHLGNYSKAAQFFKTVLANSNYFSSQHLVVDSAYYLGMCHFCSGSLIQAYELFEKTIQLDKTHPLAHFGLAQILFSRGKYQEALTTLEKIKFEIHYKSPDCQVLLLGLESLVTNLVETNKQLAAKKDPYPAQLPKTDGIAERVRPLFQLVLKLIDEAKEKKLESPWLSRAFKVLIEIGKFYMVTNPALSRTAFFNSLQILVSGKVSGISHNTPAYGELEIGILNNLGFVHLKDDVEVSLRYFKSALNRLKKYENLNKNLKGYEVTLKNNIGNCLARLEQFEESKGYLNEIIEIYPKYTNASLVLSHSYYLENKLEEACQVLKDAEQVLNSNEKPEPDCRTEGLYTYLGHFETAANKHEQGFQYHQTNLKRARDYFTKQKLREVPNIRSLIEVGNYYLNLAHHSTDKDQKWSYCVKANSHFKKAINQHPKALYAVHGVAIAFHTMGLYEDSFLIHERLQQEAYLPVTFQISYANLLIDMEKGDLAIDILEKAFKRDPSQKNPENLIALSKAYYICSQQINDLAMLTKAEDILAQLLEAKPKSRRIKYNLALVRHKYCKAIKRMSPSELPDGLQTLKATLTKLQECQAMFKELLEMGNSPNNNSLFKVKFVLDIINYNEDVQRGLISSLMKIENLPELRVQSNSSANSPQLLEGLMADEEDKSNNNNNNNNNSDSNPPSPGAKRALEIEEGKEQITEENEAKFAKTEE